MGEGKHTPGPWVTKPGRSRADSLICVEGVPPLARVYWAKGGALNANAALIAAAPDLLTAARDWIDYLDGEDVGAISREEALLGALRAAIAKATGQ